MEPSGRMKEQNERAQNAYRTSDNKIHRFAGKDKRTFNSILF